MAKIRYAGPAAPHDRCEVDDCRIRGRYLIKDKRYCYGHVSKIAVETLMEMGRITDDPQEAYVNTKRKPGQKRKYGNE